MFPGRIINGKYRILRVLGRGGMGVVSEALCLDTGQHCAIKFLREDIESDLQPTERFAREARLARHLTSPHSCRLLGIDEWELGPFIVMELLNGRALSAVLEPGQPLTWQQSVRIAYEMCLALGEAHDHGIVHRDIKPGNVFLAWSSQQRATTKVLDFGVAKVPANGITAGGGPSLTDAALLLGTPAYVAPEQLTNSKLVDARADVWALGVVMYEMLSGRLPFTSPLVPKLLLMIARDQQPSLASVAPHVPAAIGQIVDRCLFKDPRLRFPDANAVADALLPWLDRQDSLLDPLLRKASIHPLRLLSSLPPAGDLHESDLAVTSLSPQSSPDSLGPHTTARLEPLSQQRRIPRRHAIALGTIMTAAATLALALSDPFDAIEPIAPASPLPRIMHAKQVGIAARFATAPFALPTAAELTLVTNGQPASSAPYLLPGKSVAKEHVVQDVTAGHSPAAQAILRQEQSDSALVREPIDSRKPATVAPTNAPSAWKSTVPNAPNAQAASAPDTSRKLDKANPF